MSDLHAEAEEQFDIELDEEEADGQLEDADADERAPPSHRLSSPPKSAQVYMPAVQRSASGGSPSQTSPRGRSRSFGQASPPFARAHSGPVAFPGSSPSSGGGLLDLRQHIAGSPRLTFSPSSSPPSAALAAHAISASPNSRIAHAFPSPGGSSSATRSASPGRPPTALVDEPWPEAGPSRSPQLFPPLELHSALGRSPLGSSPLDLGEPSISTSPGGHHRRHSAGVSISGPDASLLRRRASIETDKRRQRTLSAGSPSSPSMLDLQASPRHRRRARSHERPDNRGLSGAATPPNQHQSLPGQDSPVSPASPRVRPVPLKSAHLAMPPPSGHDLSDDTDTSEDGSEGSTVESVEHDGDEDASWSVEDEIRNRREQDQRTTDELETDRSDDWGEPGPLQEDAEGMSGVSQTMERTPSLDSRDQDLSVLEHIFIYSKSEHREHRVAVTRALPECLEQVDICEAVEYVLPLLNGLAGDDDAVKLSLAGSLDRLMWTFYSACPLLEAEQSGEQQRPNGSASPSRDPTDEPPVERPRLSANAFVPIIGLFTMEGHLDIALTARNAFVSFFCKLAGIDAPELDGLDFGSSPFSSDELDPNSAPRDLFGNANRAPTHAHAGYGFPDSARQRLRLHLIEDVVLGLARLEPEAGEDGPAADVDMETEPPSSKTTPGTTSAEQSPKWGAPLRSFAEPPTSWTVEAAADESTAGKLVALDLITTLASSECLEPELVEQCLLPEVRTLASHRSAKVRSAACHALAQIGAMGVRPTDTDRMLAALFSDPMAGVRSSACAALASFLDLPRPVLVELIDQAASDQAKEVQHALLEVAAQLIHAMAEHVPHQLLQVFLGHDTNGAQGDDDAPFAPLSTALTDHHYNDEDDPTTLVNGFHLEHGHDTDDHDQDDDRLRAFNFPAVALALGTTGWPQLRRLYARLCGLSDPRVRRTLAASLHEIAAIIGPQHALADLVDPFKTMLSPPTVSSYGLIFRQAMEDAREVASLLIGRSAAFLTALPVPQAVELLSMVRGRIVDMPWRTREEVANGLVGLAQHLNGEPEFDELVYGLLCDQIARVRDVAIDALPLVDLSHTRLLRQFGQSSLARQRTIFVACARALIAAGHRPPYSDALLKLASDPVGDVRLALARGLPVFERILAADVRRQLVGELGQDDLSIVREAVEYSRDVPP